MSLFEIKLLNMWILKFLHTMWMMTKALTVEHNWLVYLANVYVCMYTRTLSLTVIMYTNPLSYMHVCTYNEWLCNTCLQMVSETSVIQYLCNQTFCLYPQIISWGTVTILLMYDNSHFIIRQPPKLIYFSNLLSVEFEKVHCNNNSLFYTFR